MARACRDCAICTEVTALSLVLLPVRLVLWLLFFWNVGLFMKKCPCCKHRMKHHHRMADGRFAD